jgi:hypothetical protein
VATNFIQESESQQLNLTVLEMNTRLLSTILHSYRRANASKLLLITKKVKNQRKNQDFAPDYFLSPKVMPKTLAISER